MPRHVGVIWEPWSFCQRCNFQYPLSQLVSQFGLRVCTKTCYDNTENIYRPYIIEQVLGDTNSQEGVPVTPEIQQNPEEILF